MYKYVSLVLLVLLAGAGVLYGVERYSHSKTKRESNNQIAKLEGTVKETENAYSRRALEIEGLKTDNEELQDIIDDRDEEIVALGKVAVEWKDRYIKIKNAKQTVVNQDGDPIVPPDDDPDWTPPADDTTRVRVDFEHTEDALTVSGFTLTNPPEAEIALKWNRKLNLNIILTKDDAGSFRLYADPEGSDSVPMELDLAIDPSVLERSWYENIAFNAMVAGGDGGFLIGVGAHYNILDNLYLGPVVIAGITDELTPKVYGAVVIGWRPWRSDE